MALNPIRVASYLRATNFEEEKTIQTLMDLAVDEVTRIAGGAPEAMKDQAALLWISWAFTHRGDGFGDFSRSPKLLAQVWCFVPAPKPWRKISERVGYRRRVNVAFCEDRKKGGEL